MPPGYVQWLPFQCTIRSLPFSPPTAQAFLAEVAATALRKASLGHAPVTFFQETPFQRRISALLTALPTAKALRTDVAATAARLSSVRFGCDTRVHFTPFHWSRTPSGAASLPAMPTAKASRADGAATPVRLAPPPPKGGLGLASRFHDDPFQCRMRVLIAEDKPTAQTSLADLAATPERIAPSAPGTPVNRRQTEPFQCSISGWRVLLVGDSRPTAH